ncbi:NS5-like protein [Wuhan cricket virus]|uniref:NS5-like protein n=1 Tax=Wuhan cricket virus TaxID=1746070 RepID=UPI000706A2C0|nr:NS5-like protein [Wuhan cricket virus]ALL52916.1 NS5-like protein [Wuhan cricket virus]
MDDDELLMTRVYTGVLCILALIIPPWLWMEMNSGNHNSGLDAMISRLISKLVTTELPRWAGMISDFSKQLGSQQYDKFKLRGINIAKKTKTLASRQGFAKLQDVLMQSRLHPSGFCLNLAAGAGGWGQLLCGLPTVTLVESFTLGKGPGHEGHEQHRMISYEGREKHVFHYADIKGLPPMKCDWLFFDGGEEKKTPEETRDKFNDLLIRGVLPHVGFHLKGFIIRVLTPTDTYTLQVLEDIQKLTGRGNFVRSTYSRNTTQELYFVSGQIGALKHQAHYLLIDMFKRSLISTKPTRIVDLAVRRVREVVGMERFVEPLTPLDMSASIEELLRPIHVSKREFRHWESLGVYPVGSKGSKATQRNPYAIKVTSRLRDTLTEYEDWKATDTTPEGFMQVFNTKIDTTPIENSPYDEMLFHVYNWKAKHYLKKGIRLKPLSWDEVRELANKQGAAGHTDFGIRNMADFFMNPKWKEECEKVENELLGEDPRPIKAIFNTMGKREKKKSKGVKGSRMVAYLPIPMRLIELKYLYRCMEMTKMKNNPFAVGGLGLHDLGERIREVWKGAATSSDIAGFDTRIGIRIRELEHHLVQNLMRDESVQSQQIVRNLFRVYAYPHLLIPYPGENVRSELIHGRGQRMSGEFGTYSLNTETRSNLAAIQFLVTMGIDGSSPNLKERIYQLMDHLYHSGKYGGGVSGDDEFFTSDEKFIEHFRRQSGCLDIMGFPRKDVPPTMHSVMHTAIDEVSFCSHNYTKVSYRDDYNGTTTTRYMPIRDMGEIVAKTTIWLGHSGEGLDALAWLSAQGNNLLVNYAHLRTARQLGLAYKAIPPPNLTIVGTRPGFLPKPWMRDGEILDVINDVLFGESTNYPVPGFRVRKFHHLGYVSMQIEMRFDRNFHHKGRVDFRRGLIKLVNAIIIGENTGGDITIMVHARKDHNIYQGPEGLGLINL